jgi:hypothetical protein
MTLKDQEALRYERRFNLPRELAEALASVSCKRMMSQAAYIRQALAAQLERDGAIPGMPEGPTPPRGG